MTSSRSVARRQSEANEIDTERLTSRVQQIQSIGPYDNKRCIYERKRDCYRLALSGDRAAFPVREDRSDAVGSTPEFRRNTDQHPEDCW